MSNLCLQQCLAHSKCHSYYYDYSYCYIFCDSLQPGFIYPDSSVSIAPRCLWFLDSIADLQNQNLSGRRLGICILINVPGKSGKYWSAEQIPHLGPGANLGSSFHHLGPPCLSSATLPTGRIFLWDHEAFCFLILV